MANHYQLSAIGYQLSANRIAGLPKTTSACCSEAGRPGARFFVMGQWPCRSEGRAGGKALREAGHTRCWCIPASITMMRWGVHLVGDTMC